MNDIYEDKMSEKLGPMKCIHLDLEKVDILEYFVKRGIHTLYTQPKLNGIRALWYHHDGLYTSGNNRITSVPHIIEELEKIAPNIDCDGELFHHHVPFNRINGASRSIEPTSDSLSLEHHIFDTISEYATQGSRLRDVERLPTSTFIKKVCCNTTSPKDIELNLKRMLSQGDEGIILRSLQAFYKPGRHVGNLWAIKPVYELEAAFVGFLDGETDLHSGTFGSMLLKLQNGRTFSCSGIKEYDRVRLWNHPPPQGAPVTIKFGAWSHEDRDKAVPLYPRFKCTRWDL